MGQSFRRFRRRILFLLILCAVIVVCLRGLVGCDADPIGLLRLDTAYAEAFVLVVPEKWYSAKTESILFSSYTASEGMFEVKASPDKGGLLFRKGNSENVYLWVQGTNMLREVPLRDWEHAERPRNIYSGMQPSSMLTDAGKINVFLKDRRLSPLGKKTLHVRKTGSYYDVVSFSGKIKAGRKGLMFLGSGRKYSGTAFMEVYLPGISEAVVVAKERVRESGFQPFGEAFWYDEVTLLIPNSDASMVVLVKMKHEGE